LKEELIMNNGFSSETGSLAEIREAIVERVVPETYSDTAALPMGDFLGMMGGFTAIVFAVATNMYTPAATAAHAGARALHGVSVHNPVALVCFAMGVMSFVVGSFCILARFINPNVRWIRTPGWFYGFTATAILITCILGLVAPPGIMGAKASISMGLILEMCAAATMGLGALLKFDF
jgi:hypothetical protein